MRVRGVTSRLGALAIAFATVGTMPAGYAQAPAIPEASVYDGWSVVRFLDNMVVEDAEEVRAGVVEDIIFGTSGRLLSVVVRIGGFWDIGERLVNVPWSEVEIRSATTLIVPITEASVEAIEEDQNAVLSRDEAGTFLMLRPNQITVDVWKASDAIGIPTNLSDRRAYSLVEDLIVVSDRIVAVIDNDHRTFPYEPVPASIRLSFLSFRLTRDEAEDLPAFNYRLLRGPVAE